MTTGRDEVVARMPSYTEAQFLETPPGVPVLEVLHTSFDQDGHPFEVTRFVHRADRAGLRYDFPVEN
jgi:GntR family transcriptional regulator